MIRFLVLFLLSTVTAFGQLPGSGSLSIKSAAGEGRSISQEVIGDQEGNKSLLELGQAAGFDTPISMTDFYGYEAPSEEEPEYPFEMVISLCGSGFTQSSPELSPVPGRHWNNTASEPAEATLITNCVDVNGVVRTGVNLRCMYGDGAVSASDGVTTSTIYPSNAVRSSYPAPSSGATRAVEIDLPAGTYEVYLNSNVSGSANLRTNLTVKPNGGSATTEGTVVANTGSGGNIEYEFSNNDAGIVLTEPGYIRIEWQRNTSAGGSFGRLNVIRIVKRGTGQAPSNTDPPQISGTEMVGELLTVSNGTWANFPVTFTYQWKRSGVNISGATNQTYLLDEDDEGETITCVVTATNEFGSNSEESAPTGEIQPADEDNTPVNISPPVISGIPAAEEELSVSTGTWIGDGITFSYQWKKNGANIGGATSSTYTVQESDEGQYISCVVTATNVDGSASVETNAIYITTPSESQMGVLTYNGSDKLIYYIPGEYYLDDVTEWPILLFYHGNGERGVPQNKDDLLGTGNGSRTSWSGNLTNSARILHTSVIVKVNGVAVAWGRLGVITGDGISGTYDRDDASNASYSLTFSTPPTNGHSIRMEYITSNLFGQGPLRYLNLGDEPRIIIAAPQISRPSGGFTDTEWDNALNVMTSNFRINTNRIYTTGLSLGSDMSGEWMLWNANPGTNYSFAAYVAVAPGSNNQVPPWNSELFTNADTRGKLYVRGSSDPNGNTKVPSMMANCNNSDREFPIESKLYWGLGHSSALWDNKVYNRKNRTDATGTADFDYIEWLMRFSRDPEEQATLFVRYAEDHPNHVNYRLAKRQVDNLSAGSTKTALLADLETLKSSIGNAVIVDFGPSFYSSSGNYGNITSAAASTTISNITNDEGSNSGYSLTITAATDSSPSMINDIGSLRVQGRQWGFLPNTTRDGMRVDASGTTGTLTWGGLNNDKTYTVRIYATMSSNAWSARAEMEATWGGTTKYQYVDLNNVDYLEFTGLSPSGGNIAGTIKSRQTSSTERLFYIQAIEIVEEQ